MTKILAISAILVPICAQTLGQDQSTALTKRNWEHQIYAWWYCPCICERDARIHMIFSVLVSLSLFVPVASLWLWVIILHVLRNDWNKSRAYVSKAKHKMCRSLIPTIETWDVMRERFYPRNLSWVAGFFDTEARCGGTFESASWTARQHSSRESSLPVLVLGLALIKRLRLAQEWGGVPGHKKLIIFVFGYGSIPIDTFLVGWASINPSYFDVHQGYQGFDPSPFDHLLLGYGILSHHFRKKLLELRPE